MIDINLLGEKQKAKPEITPIETPALRAKAERPGRTGRIFSLKMILLFVIAVAIVLSVLYRENILNYGKDIVAYVKTLTEEQPEPVVQQPEPVVQEPEPVVSEPEPLPVTEPVPEPEPPKPALWYMRSIEHINAYTAMVRSLPQNANYSVISVSRNNITAEIEALNEAQMVEVQNAIASAFPVYSLEFITKGMVLRVWGTLKPDAELPEVSPSEEYATHEANRNAINSVSKQHKLTIKEQNEAAAAQRANVSVVSVWMKFSGKEADILKFLTDIKEKGLSINITKISGQSKNRSESNEASELNFDFEIIM